MAKVPVTNCPAGPALDAAVARVLGWTVVLPEMKDTEDLGYPRVYWFCHEDKEWLDFAHDEEDASVHHWSPSSDIAAAWELWQHAKESNWAAFYDYLEELCTHHYNGTPVESDYDGVSEYDVMASLSPLAITRAFLLAHGVIEVEVADD